MLSINSAHVKVIYIPSFIFYSFFFPLGYYVHDSFFKAKHYIIKNEMHQKRVFYANSKGCTTVNENNL